MERILRVLFCAFVLFAFSVPAYSAGEELSLSTLISVQHVKYENCYKVFNTDNVSLFDLTIAAINANRFDIDEIQSKSGYVLFTAVNKKFLAMVSNVNTNQAMLRITPVDNNYYFQPGIVLNIFKYIELNQGQKSEYINMN